MLRPRTHQFQPAVLMGFGGVPSSSSERARIHSLTSSSQPCAPRPPGHGQTHVQQPGGPPAPLASRAIPSWVLTAL